MPDERTGARADGRLTTWWAAFRRIVGMPDYDAYVAHVRACHPGAAVPSEREYFDQYVRARYENGPTRCC
jgi:uncharacterized short protein YbdD (DUF466 family)